MYASGNAYVVGFLIDKLLDRGANVGRTEFISLIREVEQRASEMAQNPRDEAWRYYADAAVEVVKARRLGLEIYLDIMMRLEQLTRAA